MERVSAAIQIKDLKKKFKEKESQIEKADTI